MAERHSIILTVGPFPADGMPRHATWTAPEPIWVKRIVTWIGANGASSLGGPRPPVDTYTTVFGAGKVMSCFSLDCYDNFTGPHQWAEDQGDDWFCVPAGEQIVVEHFAQALNLPSTTHTQVLVYYVKY
jgi:hypothetical protein